jgi:hypothetical protein
MRKTASQISDEVLWKLSALAPGVTKAPQLAGNLAERVGILRKNYVTSPANLRVKRELAAATNARGAKSVATPPPVPKKTETHEALRAAGF